MELEVGHSYHVLSEVFPEGTETLMQTIQSFLKKKNLEHFSFELCSLKSIDIST